MSLINVSLNATLNVIGPGSDKRTNSAVGAIPTTGSNYSGTSFALPVNTTVALNTGSNADFLVGEVISYASSSLVYVTMGNTTNTASILSPLANACILAYSGSTQLYVRATGIETPVIVSYTLVSNN